MVGDCRCLNEDRTARVSRTDGLKMQPLTSSRFGPGISILQVLVGPVANLITQKIQNQETESSNRCFHGRTSNISLN
jgi:hypothetical protein